MDRKAVSVIIPCYNDERYIGQCLDSVVHQERANELLEVVVINDGSTDGSSDIIKSYCERYPYVRMITQKNAGLSAARNRGLQETSGEYIYFLDSDDYIKEKTISICYQKAVKNDADIVLFDTKPFVDGDEKQLVMQLYKRTIQPDKVYTGCELFTYMEKNMEFYPTVWLCLYSRSFILNNDLRFIEGIVYEDTPFSFEAYNLAKRVVYIPEMFHFRRTHANSIMRASLRVKHIYSNNSAICAMLDYYKATGKSQSSSQSQIRFIKRITSGNWITIISATDDSQKKRVETIRFIRMLAQEPKLLSLAMPIDILKGIKRKLHK